MKNESKVKASYVRVSARKVGQVLDLIKGKKVSQALAILQFLNKAATPSISKLLKSCVANFGKNSDINGLIVKEAYVGQGPALKRMRPGPMGRGMMYKRKTCHITIRVAKI
jgi:large subunit ribosomal protein L22